MAKDAKPLTHADRFKRRQAIAKAVKSGASLSTAARRFRVSLKTIRDACKEHGVQWEI